MKTLTAVIRTPLLGTEVRQLRCLPRLADGDSVPETMAQLAGLSQIKYVMVYPESPINRQFAATFTANYDKLAARDLVFADMQNIFDLALVSALI